LPLQHIISPRKLLDDDAKVSELIDKGNRWWNTKLLEEFFFFTFEVKEITKIPISGRLSKAKRIWHGNENGVFTLKSKYKIAFSSLRSND
jgi:hypothetical protein